jgi:hypothetical protein
MGSREYPKSQGDTVVLDNFSTHGRRGYVKRPPSTTVAFYAGF